MPAARADGYPTGRSMPAGRADIYPTQCSMLTRRSMRNPKRERPCKSKRMGGLEERIRSVMIATTTRCEGKVSTGGLAAPDWKGRWGIGRKGRWLSDRKVDAGRKGRWLSDRKVDAGRKGRWLSDRKVDAGWESR
jgi:hypothetical protein